MASLDAIAGRSDGQAEEGYKTLLTEKVNSKDVDGTCETLSHALDRLPLASGGARLARHLAEVVNACEDNGFVFDVASRAVEILKPRGMAVADADWKLRGLIFDIANTDGDFVSAARAFVDALRIPDEEQTFTYVRIAQCFLAADDTGNADVFVRRAAESVDSSTEEVHLLMLRVCRARVQDARRNFMNAAQLYIDLSRVEGMGLDPSELLDLLEDAALCTVLARPSAQRQRLLTVLARDSRVGSLRCGKIVEAAYRGRFLASKEVDAFKALLKPHHLAKLGGGEDTVLDRSVREHNVLAASRLYRNIRVADLASLIGVTEEKAELMAADMISTGALEGASIDQRNQVILFAGGGHDETLAGWDRGLSHVVAAVSRAADAVAAAHPHLAEEIAAARNEEKV